MQKLSTSLALSITNKFLRLSALMLSALAWLSSASFGQENLDELKRGPFEIIDASYKLPAKINYLVLGDRKTEQWAHVWLPKSFENTDHRKLPIIFMSHGNHPTCKRTGNIKDLSSKNRCSSDVKINPLVYLNEYACTYSQEGCCPAGYEVIENHMGYSYLAESLASWGFAVVSINANRGLTCSEGIPGHDVGLNLARGRQILTHIELLNKWNENGTDPDLFPIELKGKLDFTNVGYFGHSRGGEGVRAAYNIYKDRGSRWQRKIPDLEVDAIFELAPVDGQSSRILNALGTNWHVMLPMCDGDVWTHDGLRPYERMMNASKEFPPKKKSVSMLWGANHNYFNSKWNENDSLGCVRHEPIWKGPDGPQKQQDAATVSVVSYFKAHIGDQGFEKGNRLIDPYFPADPDLLAITHYEREYLETPNAAYTKIMDTFGGFMGKEASSSFGYAYNVTGDIRFKANTLPLYARSKNGLKIDWNTEGTPSYFDSRWTVNNAGRDISSYRTLDFSISLSAEMKENTQPVDLSLQLIMSNGDISNPLPLSRYHTLKTPIGTLGQIPDPAFPYTEPPILKTVEVEAPLSTVRIPLSDFNNVDFSQIAGVRFLFDRTAAASIILSNLRITKPNAATDELDKFDIIHEVFAAPTSTLANFALSQSSLKPVPEEDINGDLLDKRKGRHYFAQLQKQKLNSRKAVDKDQEETVVELSFDTEDEIPLAGAQVPQLTIGEHQFYVSKSEFLDDKRVLTFSLSKAEYDSLKDGDSITISYGALQRSSRIVSGGQFYKQD